jgi:hypothetical protein
MLKDELKKLYKTIEFNRITLRQYENVIKEQQNYIDQLHKKSNQYEQLCKVFFIFSSHILIEFRFFLRNVFFIHRNHMNKNKIKSMI